MKDRVADVKKSKGREVIYKLGFIAAVCVCALTICYSLYSSNKAKDIVLRSRYTYAVTINEQGEVQPQPNDDSVSHAMAVSFGELSLEQIADIWLRGFTSQYTQNYIPWTKALRNLEQGEINVLNEENNTVLVKFTAELMDESSEYFSSWDGFMEDGRMSFGWVVSFIIDDHSNGLATIYVGELMTPEDYGIEQYNRNHKDEEETKQELMGYAIKDGILSVTYDNGKKYTTVPVSVDELKYEEDEEQSGSKLKKDSYVINEYMTAFVYGGTKQGENKTPVTVIYSDDKGKNWISVEIDKIYTADYYYIDFFSENNGVIVIGYNKTETQQNSKIYTTVNGGETWEYAGTGPEKYIIKGVIYADENTGFFAYEYDDDMTSNLYVTHNGAISFDMVIFEAQELDSTASSGTLPQKNESTDNTINSGSNKLSWSDVYKEATVPVIGDNDIITVYLTQGDNGVYNDGKTVAKYQTTDNGATWKYVGQLEVSIK